MNKFLSIWRSAHNFVLKNFLILLIFPILIIWGESRVDIPEIYPQIDRVANIRGGEMEMSSAMMVKSGRASNIIAPEIMAEDGFDAREDSERKIVKNASIEIRVEDPELVRGEIETKIKNFSGKIQNVNSWQVREGVLGYNLVVRVPAEKLQEVLKEIGKIGEKTGENISSQDITRQYYDSENRLKNLETHRDRLRDLLEFETKNLADILSVDREIMKVQNEIESLTNTQNRRDTDVAFSSLQIGIQPLSQIGDIENPLWSAKQSWRSAVNNLIENSQELFDWALEYIVLAPIWLPILLLFIWLKRKFWKKKK